MSGRRRPSRRALLHAAAFGLALAGIAWLYDYPRVAPLGPISHHAWRQADGASLALNYHSHGMRFFEPRLHNLLGGDGRTAGELPILYYAAAALYSVLGHQDAVFRCLNLAVLALGLFLFSRSLLRTVGDLWLALAPPLLLLGSPLIAFYGFNFLPNTTAFGLVLIAAHLYLRYAASAAIGWLYGGAVVAALAGLIKVSSLIPFLALVATAALLWTVSPAEARRSGLPRPRHLCATSLLVLGANVAWYAWARHYNELHGSSYFLLGAKPFWELPSDRAWSFASILLFRQRRWYFHGAVLITLASLLGWLLFSRRLPIVPRSYLRLVAAGSAAFLLLFFGQLKAHEYYFIDVMPLAALVLGLAAWVAATHAPRLARSHGLRLALVLLIALNLAHASGRMRRLYGTRASHLSPPLVSLNERDELRRFLADLRIDPSRPALVLGDPTPNVSLYYLDMPGWTRAKRRLGPRARAKYLARGARYLVVLAPFPKSRDPYPGARPIAAFGGQIRFYDLTPRVERVRYR